MSFKESLRNLFRGSMPEEERAHQAELHQESLAYAQQVLYGIYAHGETFTAELSESLPPIPQELSDRSKGLLRQMHLDSLTHQQRLTDKLNDLGEERIFTVLNIPPDEGLAVRIRALEGAKLYWEQRAGAPDLTSRQEFLRRRRLAMINEKLEKLTEEDNPQNPK